jgi:hypothetical protein
VCCVRERRGREERKKGEEERRAGLRSRGEGKKKRKKKRKSEVSGGEKRGEKEKVKVIRWDTWHAQSGWEKIGKSSLSHSQVDMWQ